MAEQKLPTHRDCGTMMVHRRLLDSDPEYARRLARIEDQAFRARDGFMLQRAGCTRIPVVVHVIWKTAAQNVSQAQIDSQIEVLNRDFRKRNSDLSKIPAAFSGVAADARVQFALAVRDPQGNPHDGVIRVQTTKDGFDSDDAVKHAASGGSDAWPRDEYLNLWVCQLVGGLLGYAQFPGGPADTDGVVVTHTGFGTTGTAAAPFNLGRTATHEIGHWLNLRHIWGDDGTGCSGSDYVDDTPNQGGPNAGKPVFPIVSCNNGPNGDMFMNYMDYVDDDSMMMFSQGQVTRMQACLDGPRSSIGESIPCSLNPKLPVKDLPKDHPKDLIKDNPKEFAKDIPKDNTKDIGKDGHKDNPKEFVKDFPKDGHKDFPKDNPKDFAKDIPKDRPKDFIKEHPFDPGPKTIFEPPVDPKSGFEPPFQPPVVVPGGGLAGVGIAGGMAQPSATPFVIGTGSAPGNAPSGPAVAAPAQSPMLGHYASILQTYASLYQRGLLDQQGMTAWQQAYDAYRQMGGE